MALCSRNYLKAKFTAGNVILSLTLPHQHEGKESSIVYQKFSSKSNWKTLKKRNYLFKVSPFC